MASSAGNDEGDSGDQTVKSIIEFLKNYKEQDYVKEGRTIPVIVAHSVGNDFVNGHASAKIEEIMTKIEENKKKAYEEYVKGEFASLVAHSVGNDFVEDIASQKIGEIGKKLDVDLNERWKEHQISEVFQKSNPDHFKASDFFAWLILINKLNYIRSIRAKGDKNMISFPKEKWIYEDNANQKHAVEFTLYKVDKSSRGCITHWLEGFGSYEKIREKIKTLKLDISQELGGFFQNGITKHVGEGAKCLSELHGLLFGMEVMRSPLNLIINMMILDLLKWDKNLKLDDVFPNKEQREPDVFNSLMPCTMIGSVMALREINDKFPSNRKWRFDDGGYGHLDRYSSEGQQHELAVSKTIEKSREVIIRWLKLSGNEELAGSLEKVRNCIDDEPEAAETIQNLTEILSKACQQWFLPIEERLEKLSL